jgi:hypothetical protein
MERHTKAEKKSKKTKESGELFVLAPIAAAKLAAQGADVSKLTKKEICAVLLSFFQVLMPESTPKPALVKCLNERIASKPSALADTPVILGGATEMDVDGGGDDGELADADDHMEA